jgi:hypothetical protein
MRSILFSLFLVPVLACADRPVSPGLLRTSELGSLRGLLPVRAITHFHTPYSFDACDGKGIAADGTPNAACWDHARAAFCENHINYIFATDHTDRMAETSFQDLVLLRSGDTLLLSGTEPVGNRIACADGFAPVLSPGLEGKWLALGMQRHVPGDLATRQAVYGAEDAASKASLENDAGALVAVPHTESRDFANLLALAPQAIEIYNLHANLDPKIRKKYLGRPPFEKLGAFINFLADPYKELNPDYLFLDFIEFNSVYFETWNRLLAAGLPVTGIGGLDSHENIFPQKAADGERLDQHRRMTRFINNFVLTNADDSTSVKSAIAAGRVYFVVEGLGTPTLPDFHGTVAGSGATIEMGGTMTPGADASELSFSVPSVHASFPGMGAEEKPQIRAELIRVDSNARETVVARGSSAISYLDPPAGHYRVQVWIRPKHLKDFLFDEDRGNEEFLWIIGNPIRVVR